MAKLGEIKPRPCEADHCDRPAAFTLYASSGQDVADFCAICAPLALEECEKDEEAQTIKRRTRELADRLTRPPRTAEREATLAKVGGIWQRIYDPPRGPGQF